MEKFHTKKLWAAHFSYNTYNLTHPAEYFYLYLFLRHCNERKLKHVLDTEQNNIWDRYTNTNTYFSVKREKSPTKSPTRKPLRVAWQKSDSVSVFSTFIMRSNENPKLDDHLPCKMMHSNLLCFKTKSERWLQVAWF